MRDQFIYTCDDVLRMLDALLARSGSAWWDQFFADPSRPCPFLAEWPDENLAAWFCEGLLTPGRVFDLARRDCREPESSASLPEIYQAWGTQG